MMEPNPPEFTKGVQTERRLRILVFLGESPPATAQGILYSGADVFVPTTTSVSIGSGVSTTASSTWPWPWPTSPGR